MAVFVYILSKILGRTFTLFGYTNVRVPQKWSEVTLSQFYELRSVLDMRDIPNIDRNVQLVSILSDKPIEEVEELSFNKIAQIISGVKFLDKMPDPKASKYLYLKGRLFKICLNPERMTPAQFIDLSMFTKDPKAIIENAHNIMAVICVPVFGKYNGKKHKDIADFFLKNLDVQKAYATALFFCKLINAFLEAISTYLEQSLQSQMKNLQTLSDSLNTGDGTIPSTKSAEGII